jgi:hypothetical protein
MIDFVWPRDGGRISHICESLQTAHVLFGNVSGLRLRGSGPNLNGT